MTTPTLEQKILALTDFWEFLDLINFKGGRGSFDPVFHKELSDFLTLAQRSVEAIDRRRLILVARGHLKSTLCTVLYSLWRIYRNPNIRIVVATATKDLALLFIVELRQYLESEYLQETVWNARPHYEGKLIPVLDKGYMTRRQRKWEDPDATEASDKKIIWRANAVQVLREDTYKEPTVFAASPGVNITGQHYDLVIKDDIINDDTVATQAKIDRTLRWAQDMESVLDPIRKVRMGQLQGHTKPLYEFVGDEDVVLGTRYSFGDYYQHLIENLDIYEYKMFTRTVYKNGRDNKDGYTWGAKFTDTVVKRIKLRQGHRRFAAQYLNMILADEDRMLHKDAIQWMHQYNLTVQVGKVEVLFKDAKFPIDVKPYLVVDPAISQRKGADNTVIMVGGIDFNRTLYIFDFKFGKYTPSEMIATMYELLDRWKLHMAVVETVSYQKVIPQMIKHNFGIYRPIAIKEYLPKGEKLARIKSNLEPLFDAKKIYMMQWMSSCDELITEIEYLGATNVHDDLVDAMSMLVEVSTRTAERKRGSNVYRLPVRNRKYGGVR